MPKVSVCLPTYEPKPEHLREAIDCVLSQTVTDWELIINDDNSPKTDVRAIVEPYLKDKRITFTKSEGRGGIGKNWNTCLKRAQGEYLQLMFQDDWWQPRYLEASIEALEKNPTALFSTAHHLYCLQGDPEFVAQVKPTYDFVAREMDLVTPGPHENAEFLSQWLRQGLYPNMITEPSYVMIRRSTYENVGPYDEVQKQGLDMDYWVRCMLLPGCFVKIGEDLGAFRVHAAAASARNARENRGFLDRLATYEKLLALDRSAEWKRAVRRSIATQFSVMGKRFLKRTSSSDHAPSSTPSRPKLSSLLPFLARHPLITLRGIIGVFL